MRSPTRTPLTLAMIGLALARPGAATAAERHRGEIPERLRWDLTPLFPDQAAWRRTRDRLASDLSRLDACPGTLGKSGERLLECLELASKLGKELTRLHVYASLRSDEDTRVAANLALVQEMEQLATRYAARTAFLEPEVLALDRARVEDWAARVPGLAVYRHYLDDVLRRKAHTLSAPEEKLLADAGLVAGAAEDIYSVFADADFPHPELTLADGSKVTLDQAAFALHRASPVRADRARVFQAYFGAWSRYRRTMGATLYAAVNANIFHARARRYDSAVEAALDRDNIPVTVYRALVDSASANLGTLHRYLELRRRLLGVEALEYHDLYVPLVEGADRDYPVDEAKAILLAAFAPLGKEYLEATSRSLDERWIDWMPGSGKRSGAYSEGSAYDVHPYMLLNYNGRFDDLSTLAHEIGHALHSWLANRSQPYPTANYTTFVAEVASTFNEALLIDHLLARASDDRERLTLLGHYLEGFKGTVFRQVQFAEFELRIHEQVEAGETLTGESLDALYLEIARRYYGHAKGVCRVGDEIASEWAYVSHFYYNFYVFQYATSFTAATAIAERVKAGDAEATRRYLDLLRAGGSDYPVELLRRAGVDMTTGEPFALTMRRMNRVMDEIEAILARRGEKR